MMFSIGVFAVILDAQKRVLLCHRRDLDKWNLPGGGVQQGEMPIEAVVRETKEETGLEVTVERLTGVYGKPNEDDFVFTFVCKIVGGRLAVTDEAQDCQYFAINNMPLNTLPKHLGRIYDALNYNSQPMFRLQTESDTLEMLQKLKKPE